MRGHIHHQLSRALLEDKIMTDEEKAEEFSRDLKILMRQYEYEGFIIETDYYGRHRLLAKDSSLQLNCLYGWEYGEDDDEF